MGGFNFFLWPNENNYFSNLFNYLLLLEIKVLAKTVPTKVPEIYCGQLPKNSLTKNCFFNNLDLNVHFCILDQSR